MVRLHLSPPIIIKGIIMSPFKPKTSRIDKLEIQLQLLMERVAKLEKDLTYFIMKENGSN
tara:strand:+ start:1220 stop:1399 length:180 start_codon:yes stop_codon:yes gene_type:complete